MYRNVNAKYCKKGRQNNRMIEMPYDLSCMLKKNDTRDHLGKEKYGNKWNYNNQGKSDCNLNSKYNFQKKIKYYKVEPNSNGPIRLNRYLANSGLCSRRKADKYIQTGLVKKMEYLLLNLEQE